MGFYGHISNIQRTSMTFDKIYPNRTTMDNMVDKDGIYAGRYVLVEYDNTLESDQLPAIIQFDGLLYNKPAARDNWLVDDKDPTSPTSYLVKLNPLTVGINMEENVVGDKIKAGITVVCPKDINFTVNDKNVIVSQAIKQYFKIAENGTVNKESYNLLYNYITKEYQLDESASKENKTGCAFTEVYYSLAPEDDTKADENYTINYAIDRENYDSARGYDSTVWQKTYVDGKAKYVMIAELNSIVPALGVVADAPTQTPLMPHFSKDSTNIYYELHMQPSWGFRIKAANPDLRLPKLDADGYKQTGVGSGNIIARDGDTKKYPSDEKITWTRTTIGKSASDNSDNYNITYLSEQDDIGRWTDDEEATIAGAIYYNKAGFDKSIISHSKEKDEIALTPTGRSGYIYYTHDTDGNKEIASDMNELSIMLPSIGNTIADVWDLIYGDEKVNGESEFRNTTIRWEDAKKVQAKEGLRLVNNNSLLGYTYDFNAVNTLAGVINSAQDIIGMIITDDYPVSLDNTEAIKKLNDDYIYYQDKKYYFKKPTYDYTPVNGDNPIEKVELANWDEYKDKAWWKDTNNLKQPDFIQEETYRPEREYVLGVKVPGADDKGTPRQFDGAQYEKGKYFIKTKYNSRGEELVEKNTKAPFHIYYKSQDEKRQPDVRYMDAIFEETQLEDKGVYYVPNKFYMGIFVETEIKDEADFNKKIQDGVRLFKGPYHYTGQGKDFGLVKTAIELKAGDYSEINGSTVYYLTLETCDWTAEQYRNTNENSRPILFHTSYDKPLGQPQSYYVVKTEYQKFTEYATIKASPGVYYYIEKAEGKTESDYVDDKGYLKPGLSVVLEEDVNLDTENCIYFRKIVTLELSEADAVVNIQEAQIVQPKDLPANLYHTYNEDGRVGYYEVTATSDIITNSKNCGDIKGLYILTFEKELVVGYESDTYYYEREAVESDVTYTSLLTDSRKEPDKEEYYWTPDMINKLKLTSAEVEQKRQPGETYYVYDEMDNTYKIYEDELIPGKEYYVSSLSDAPEFYTANKYYYRNGAGEYVLDTSEEFTEGREYFKNPQLYVIEDPNGFYEKGATWPLGTNPPEDSGIILGKREKTWMLEELKGFDVHFNTLHGLLLRLNQWMLQNDTLTRDDATLQGALNKLNDLIHRFGKMEAGQVMMVDNAGRMRGADVNTRETFLAKNFGNQSVEIIGLREATPLEATAESFNRTMASIEYNTGYTFASAEKRAELDAQAQTEQNIFGDYYTDFEDKVNQRNMVDGKIREDLWINAVIDPDYSNPSISITHNFTKVKDTTSVSDLNTSQSDTIDLYAPIVDNKGHVVGHNTETVTLPYGYKKVNLLNSSSELDSPDDLELVIQDKVIANNTQDTLLFKAGNKWIKFDATSGAVNDTVHVYHETEDQRVAVTKNTDLNDGTSTIGPVLQSFTRDRAGHVNDLQPVSYTLPNGYSQFKTGEDAISNAQNTMDTFVFSGDNWILPTITQGKLTLTHTNEAGLLPAGVDTIGTQNPSFGESFNMWAYELDDNGHCINHQKEAIYLPTSIEGLKTPAELDKYYAYIKTNQSLTDALIALETGINDLSNWAVGAISDAYLDLAQKTIQKDATFDYGDEKLTINELFAKVKALENQLTT